MSNKARWPNRVNIGLTDESYKKLQRVRSHFACNPDRGGFVERVLMQFALNHVEQAFDEWIEAGSQRTRFRRSVGVFIENFEASRSAARSFIESFEKE